MPAAMHGVGSLLSPTTSLQSEHVFGHVSVNDTGRISLVLWGHCVTPIHLWTPRSAQEESAGFLIA